MRRLGRVHAAGSDCLERTHRRVDRADVRPAVEPARGECRKRKEPWRLLPRQRLYSPHHALGRIDRDSEATRPSKRKNASQAGRRADGKLKTTIVMDSQVDFRLGAVAASLRVDRSTLAAKLIDDGLKRYALDAVLRQFSDRQETAGDSSSTSQANATAA